jgi:hypothetical protein
MNFILKSILKKQLSGVSDGEIDRVIAIIEKNPEFFKQLAEKIKQKTDGGMSAEDAARQIMAEEGEALKKLA